MPDATHSTDGGSKERIALELATRIQSAEYPDGEDRHPDDPRAYWLHLYGQCLEAVSRY